MSPRTTAAAALSVCVAERMAWLVPPPGATQVGIPPDMVSTVAAPPAARIFTALPAAPTTTWSTVSAAALVVQVVQVKVRSAERSPPPPSGAVVLTARVPSTKSVVAAAKRNLGWPVSAQRSPAAGVVGAVPLGKFRLAAL